MYVDVAVNITVVVFAVGVNIVVVDANIDVTVDVYYTAGAVLVVDNNIVLVVADVNVDIVGVFH